jgi:hypothetical protein
VPEGGVDVNVRDHLDNCSGIWRPDPPAPLAALERLSREARITLPQTYLELLAISNGGEGDLAIEPGWVALWPVESVLELNQQYELASFVPGLFGIGSNGGGELIALDARHGVPFPVVCLPFIPLNFADALVVASSFDEFVPLIGASVDAAPPSDLA